MYKLIKVADCLDNLSIALRELAANPSKPVEKPEPKAEPEVTLEQMRSLLGQLSTTGHSDEVKAIVKKYGRRLSEIDSSHYPDMLKEAGAIKDAAG